MPKERIVLVVDDDAGLSLLLGCVAQEHGLRVETARDGVEAVGKIPYYKPDLIILDLMLPRMSGYDILQMLQSGGASKTPILVVTGAFIDQIRDRIAACPNVVDILQKPIKPERLQEAIIRALEGSVTD
ncbi:MAG: response regulator [Elusimicrobia bacterium]|nr:response regulator [Elusimicrobiota bacterium]